MPPLSWNEIKSRALGFSRVWADASNEDAQGKPFWIDFFEIFGITDKRVGSFEHSVKRHGGGKGYVDLFWPGMLLVEHKSRGKSLDKAFAQALDYFPGIPERDLPRLIIVCDFARFRLYWLDSGEQVEFALADLHKHIKAFAFIAGYRTQDGTQRAQAAVDVKAAEQMGRLHDRLCESGYTEHTLEVLLVRLLFCLFADDTAIFQPAQMFRTFLEERTAEDGSDLGPWLGRIFQVLNTPEEKRSKALDAQLRAFPYVNGRLFEEVLPLADFDAGMRDLLLDACALDWSGISPAIFGSLFQSIMDKDARRALGAHYTSEENILKLIKPLFLDDLWAEFERVKNNRTRLFEFHKRLRLLTFFDPACGCGNFLVIAYRELRQLELAVLRASHDVSQMNIVSFHGLVRVDVDQFYGIELEEFPAQIAQVALWLMDHQMNLQVSEEFGWYYARIPLRTAPKVVHGNALRLNWAEVLAPERCTYLLGNPPFVGAKYLSDDQRADVAHAFGGIDNAGLLDLVAAWYVKAVDYLKQPSLRPEDHGAPAGAETRVAFVSTNSIAQGEQVGVLWKWLLAQGVRIHFAHRTFKWTNEARGKAAVHCVIIGFGLGDVPRKVIFEYLDIGGDAHAVVAKNINPYLVDAPDVVLTRRSEPVSAAPTIGIGNKPIDGGHYLFTGEERDAFVAMEPASAKWFRRWLGSDEFLNGWERWCLWLGECPPSELRSMPEALKRVQAVKKFRLASKSAPTRKLADTPTRFHVENMPSGRYLIVPKVSSERRQFIPVGYEDPTTLCSDLVFVVPEASLYHLGVLSSTMHNAWMRLVAGRLKSDYRYSKDIVYNNFPWPELAEAGSGAPTAKVQQAEALRQGIARAAQGVLDARAAFPTSTLADLYDPLSMPPELVRAHRVLDAAVDKAYELEGGRKRYTSDAERVAFLFERYQAITSLLPAAPAKERRR